MGQGGRKRRKRSSTGGRKTFLAHDPQVTESRDCEELEFLREEGYSDTISSQIRNYAS